MAIDDASLREMARNRGLRLVKSRRRKPGGDFGLYGLADAKSGKPRFGFGKDRLSATAGEIQSYLRGQVESGWKSSLTVAGRKAPKASKPKPRWQADAAKAPARNRGRAAPEAAEASPRPVRERAQDPVPGPVIREAVKSDMRSITALLAAEGEGAQPAAVAKAAAALRDARCPLLVADSGGVVGCAAYAVVRTLQHRGPIGRITLLLVARESRRRGIGGTLLAAAERRLRRLGCTTFELVNDIELSNANSFLRGHDYGRAGYRFVRDAKLAERPR